MDDYEEPIDHIRAQLRVVAADDGGPPAGVPDGHAPNWGIGQRLSGDGLLARARITIEDAERLAPGGTGSVRIHPTSWDAWANVRPGEKIPMLEGPRIVGIAEVVEVVWRDSADPPFGN